MTEMKEKKIIETHTSMESKMKRGTEETDLDARALVGSC